MRGSFLFQPTTQDKMGRVHTEPDVLGERRPSPSRRTIGLRPASLEYAARTGSAPAPPASAQSPRVAANFLALSVAEIVCRGISVGVTLYLARTLGKAGFGRIEFAFNIAFWLVLLVREGMEVLAAREIARHPKLIRPLVNQVLAIRLALALPLFAGLSVMGSLTLTGGVERLVLSLYALLLVTTALGLDFAFRGLERMGLIAISLVSRTLVYAVGVVAVVTTPARLVWVPVWLVVGEACGISFIWFCYVRRFGLPRPAFGSRRFLGAMARRGQSVYAIQVAQALVSSVDLLVVGMMSHWSDIGLYSAPHRMVTAVLTFGLIFQQVVFPRLARSWRNSADQGRQSLELLVQLLLLGTLPIALGTTVLSRELVQFLFRGDYDGGGLLLALGIWRVPLFTLAFLFQTALIALNRERSGVRLVLLGTAVSVPLVVSLRALLGLPGAALAELLVGASLVVAGHRQLACLGRAPSWMRHLRAPCLAALPMIAVCKLLAPVHVVAAVGGGAIVYLAALWVFGATRREGDLWRTVSRIRQA